MNQMQTIPLEQIQPSSLNPRKTFDQAALDELASSIREKGVLQPIVVRPKGDAFELVAGERRYRASKLAEQADIPAMVRDLDDKQVLEIMVIENDQREGISPLEQADGYAQMVANGHTVETIAAKIGRPRAYVTGRLKIGGLDAVGKEKLATGILTMGGALVLAKTSDSEQLWKWWGATHAKHIGEDDVRRWLKERYPLVSSFRFPLEDAELDKKMGPCLTCAFNTGCNGDLFDDHGDPKLGSCTKPTCAKKKLAAFVDRQLEHHADLQRVTTEGRREDGSVYRWDVQIGPIDADPEEFPETAIYADGGEVGKLIRIKRREFISTPDPEAAARIAEREAERREREVAEKVQRAGYARLAELFSSPPSVPAPIHAIAIALLATIWKIEFEYGEDSLGIGEAMGWKPSTTLDEDGEIEESYDVECLWANLAERDISIAELAKAAVLTLAEVDSFGGWNQESAPTKCLQYLCRVAGVDLKKVRKDVDAQKEEPADG